MHVAYLSTMVGVACITVFHEIVTEAKSRFKNGFLLLLLLFYMFMLQGRMNVLALIIVMAFAFLIYVVQYRNWKWLFLPILPIILVAVLFPILPESVSSRYLQLPDLNYDISGEESDFNSATYRFAEWKGAGEVIAEHFFFGTGVGDNRDALINAYEEIGFHVGVDHRYNAHNQYIETFIASGLVGFLLLLSFMGYWLYKLFQAKDLSALLGLLFFMLCMLTESMLERAWAVIFLAVYFSVMVLSNRPDLEVKNRL